MTADELKALVRTVPDFPREGIQFRDVTTLIADPAGLASAVGRLATTAEGASPDLVAGIEARGFIFGAAVAARLGCGFLPIRKAGKLPVATISEPYALEYGEDRLELDPSLLDDGQRVVLIDDLIATGGTALAAISLLRRAGANVVAALFAIDLPDLGGMPKLRAEGIETAALMEFAGD